MARVLRSASWLFLSYGVSQGLRLASNLILTRILFPEAFGLMALVSLVIVGLGLFSDLGVGTMITQHRRGDDPVFLDTAWSVQVLRGCFLWLMTWLLAWPFAAFYGEPSLALYLPVAGFVFFIGGFSPMRIETANRHLLLGRLTILDLVSQLLGLTAMVALALATRSVMSLALGAVLQTVFRLVLVYFFLPGRPSRFRWETEAASEMLHYGKWILLSTALWFISSQGDKAILGKFLSLETLGIYNIGFFLASFPYQMGLSVNQRLMMPVYRDKPAGASRENFVKLRLLRSAMTGGVVSVLAVMAFVGPWLVDVLYDPRYALSGHVVTLISCSLIPSAILMTYDQAALSAGDSRGFFIYSAARATAQVSLILAGVTWFGLPGAILAMGVSTLLTYPVLIWLSVRHKVWDWQHDLVFGLLGGVLAAVAIWLHWGVIADLFATGR